MRGETVTPEAVRPVAAAAALALTALAAAAPVGAVPRGAVPSPDTLDLEEAIRTALGRNPRMKEARADVSEQSAARWADWGALLPSVDASAGFDRTEATRFTFEGEEGKSEKAPEPIDFTRISASQSLSFTWTVLDGGRRLADLNAGAARRDAAGYRLSDEERKLVADVERSFYDALEKERLADVADRQLDARKRELEVTRRRLEAGVATRVDLLGARVEIDEARLRLLDARDRADRARRQLRRDMGLSPAPPGGERPLAAIDSLPDTDGLRTADLVERARSADPLLKAFEADAQAASASRLGGWTDYLPEITAGYDLSRAESGGPGSPFVNFDPSDRFNTVSVELSWNVFDGFDRREETARAAAELTRARASRRERALEIERRVGDLVGEARRRRSRVEVLRGNLRHARERLELARESYEQGVRTFDEFQPFIDEARDAEKSLVEERFAFLEAWADLEELVGDLDGPSRR